VACFFREVCKKPKITKEVLIERTRQYQAWVAHYARNHGVPLLWPDKGMRKEDLVRPRQQRMIREKRFGIYYILQSMEQGWTFRAIAPKFATKDPNFQFVRKHKSRYTHYYFYIVDEVLGPMALRAGSFLPFQITAYLNGHNFIERQLLRQKIAFKKEDNRFVWVEDPAALQEAADQLNGKILQERIDYWALIVGPKFSARERFQQITDRFAHSQAEHLNVHGQFDVLARLAKPVFQGKTKVAGIKLENTRLMRLLELLMQGAGGHLRQFDEISKLRI
jgi:hypothetical protein